MAAQKAALRRTVLTSSPVIIEYCCDPSSIMGQIENKCLVIRITKEQYDQTTPEGREAAKEIAQAHLGALRWTSLPCTAGCPWLGLNEQRPGDGSARRRRVREFLAILSAWLPLAREVKRLGMWRDL